MQRSLQPKKQRRKLLQKSRENLMLLVVLLLVLALILGGVGLFVEGLKWLLIIALVLLVAGAVFGFLDRRKVR
jgi:membrane protein YdbS with pleckstrin-like domain